MSNMGAYERIAFLESRMAKMEAVVASQAGILARLLTAAPEYMPDTLEDGPAFIIKDTARQVAAAHNLSYAQIMGRGKAERFSHPRQRAWLLMTRAGIPVSKISDFFQMDRQTVTYGVRMAGLREAALAKSHGIK